MKKIIVYGSGCSTCHKLKTLIENTAKQENIIATVDLNADYAEMAKLNIISTPAVSIDGDIKITGRAPSKNEIIN